MALSVRAIMRVCLVYQHWRVASIRMRARVQQGGLAAPQASCVLLRRSEQCAELIAHWVTQIREIHFAAWVIAIARWVFTTDATVG